MPHVSGAMFLWWRTGISPNLEFGSQSLYLDSMFEAESTTNFVTPLSRHWKSFNEVTVAILAEPTMKKKATKAAKAIFGRSSKSDESRRSSPPIKEPSPTAASTISEAAPGSSQPPTSVGPKHSPRDPQAASKVDASGPTTVNSGSDQNPDNTDKSPVQVAGLMSLWIHLIVEHVSQRSAPSRSVSELEEAIKEFKENYSLFARKKQKYILIDGELDDVFLDEITYSNVKSTAKFVGGKIRETQQITKRKNSIIENTWTGQIGHFFTSLYPVAKLSCGLMGSVADVPSIQAYNFNQQSASFAPLKGAASGLGIILQVWVHWYLP